MKKYLTLIFTVFLLLGFSGYANALSFDEGYKGCQVVNEGDTVTFGFDFWGAIDDDPGIGGFNDFDNMTLVNDAVGVTGQWESAELNIDFYSRDWARETAGIHFFVLDEWGGEVADFDLGLVSGFLYGTYSYSYTFTPVQLDLLTTYCWGYAEITAVRTPCFNYNDFIVKKVGMTVKTASETPVPEPATMMMLATGLVGMAGLIRKTGHRR
jgi:hypothetical protein